MKSNKKYERCHWGPVTAFNSIMEELWKKISYIIFDLLTIAFLIGAYAIQYFTKKKLGMLRWVNYHNMQFQKNAVYGIVKYITF